MNTSGQRAVQFYLTTQNSKTVQLHGLNNIQKLSLTDSGEFVDNLQILRAILMHYVVAASSNTFYELLRLTVVLFLEFSTALYLESMQRVFPRNC